MNVRVHLLSPPGPDPNFTSIQTACLRSYVEATFGDRVPVHCYSPHTTLAWRLWGTSVQQSFLDLQPLNEYLSLLAYRRKFTSRRHEGAVTATLNADLKRRGCRTRLPRNFAAKLVEELDSYIEQKLVPALTDEGLNVVGLTTSFDQVYASLYFIRYLREHHPGRRYLFLLGGASITLPEVVPLLRRCGLPLLLVIGEGEVKLTELLGCCLDAAPGTDPETLRQKIGQTVHGVLLNEDERVDDLVHSNPYRKRQVELEALPLPNYDAHFAELAEFCDDDATLEIVKQYTTLTIEGSRGCFAKCDFCGLNDQWDGFRSNSSENVVRAVELLGARHGARTIRFVDNVCDTWAERFAEEVIRSGMQYRLQMELRSAHPEPFWTKIALAGVVEVQIGVEALSDPLLMQIEKKTSVMQNLSAQKYVGELGIASMSNIMLNHPKSTLVDVAETRRILALIPHFPRLTLTRFFLAPGSPLYREFLEGDHGDYPRHQPLRLPREVDREALGFLRTPPAVAVRPNVRAGWTRLARWFHKFMADRPNARMDVFRLDGRSLVIHDNRSATAVVHRLYDDDAAVYSACHRATSVREIADATQIPESRANEILARFARDELLVTIGDRHLALALRPRDELVQRLHREPARQRVTRLPIVESRIQVPGR